MIAVAARNAFSPHRLATVAEARIVDAFGLAPRPLPQGFADARGTLRGGALSLTTRAYRSDRLPYFRVVRLAGDGLEIANLVGFPDEASGLPIFGADLVALSGRPGLAAVDLSGGSVPAGRLPERGLPRDPLPTFCAAHFSPSGIFCRFEASMQDRVEEAFFDRVDAFARLGEDKVRGAPRPGQNGAYARSHAEEDRTLNLLCKAFSPDWARAFVEGCLFPVVIPGEVVGEGHAS